MTETAKTVDQALRVLTEVVAHGPVTAQDLARTLELNRTACHRLLATLHARGFVRKDGSSYMVGHALWQIAHALPNDLVVRARPVLRALADKHGETFLLTVVDGDDAVGIDQQVGDSHPLRVSYPIGNRHPLHAGSSGRALLAHLSEAHIERAATRVPDRDHLLAQLAQVRADGFCVSHGELHATIIGVSVPVLDHSVPLASLTVLAPVERGEQVRALVPELQRAAATIRDTVQRRR